MPAASYRPHSSRRPRWRRRLRTALPRRTARGVAWVGGNCVELLPLGEALFPALLRAWGAARSEIWLETYIFHDDAIARALAQALVDAARRGVRVRVLVDGLGSNRSIATLRATFDDGGVEFMVYRPWQHWFDLVQRGHWRRLHRKLCVVDGREAFVGGINLIDDRLDLHHGWSAQPRLDYAVALRGPAVAQVRASMRRLWLRTATTGSVRRQLAHAPGPDLLRSAPVRRRYLAELFDAAAGRAPAPPQQGCAGAAPTMRAALVVRDNLLHRRAIEHAYVRAIDRARRSVLLVTPYFYPGQTFRDALKGAAARGVEVTLLLQGRADYRAAAWAAQALYAEMLHAGVGIFEYHRAFLHGKVAVIDELWATVGSSNIDPLSLLVNREANLLVRDAAFAATLARHVRAQLADAVPIDGQRLRRRVAWWVPPFVAVVARLFIALAGGTRRY